jgi:hypothetical protein
MTEEQQRQQALGVITGYARHGARIAHNTAGAYLGVSGSKPIEDVDAALNVITNYVTHTHYCAETDRAEVWFRDYTRCAETLARTRDTLHTTRVLFAITVIAAIALDVIGFLT